MCKLYVYVVTLFLTYVSCRTTNNLYKQGSSFAFPKTFAECTDMIVNPSTPKYVVQAVQSRCLDGFISVDHTHRWARNMTSDEQNYIKSVFRKVIDDAAQLNKLRHKRDVGLFPRRLRREVRAAPYQNWQNYARNVRRLKYETVSKWKQNYRKVIINQSRCMAPDHRMRLIHICHFRSIYTLLYG